MRTIPWNIQNDSSFSTSGLYSSNTSLDRTDLSALLRRIVQHSSRTVVVQEQTIFTEQLLLIDPSSVLPQIEVFSTTTISRELPGKSKDIPAYANRAEIVLREQSRAQRLQFFLSDLARSESVEHDTAIMAWRTWLALAEVMAHKLPVPDVAAGVDKQILFSWNSGEHHFELEIYPSGMGEFFYLNYQTDKTWEEEYHIGDLISADVINYLKLFSLYD